MKKWMFLLVSLFTMQVAMADNDKPITFEHFRHQPKPLLSRISLMRR